MKFQFLLIILSIFLTACGGSSSTESGDLQESSSKSASTENRDVAASSNQDGGSIIDLSGGESEKATSEQIRGLFSGKFIKDQLQLIYHRIQYLREKDKSTNFIINTFDRENEAYVGLDKIIDQLFSPDKEGETIFEKMEGIHFNLRDDRNGRECFGEYHFQPDSPLRGEADWRDMSINHRTKEICVSIPRFSLTDSNKLYERVMSVLAMETSHLMGYNREQANLLRNWFSRHPYIVLSRNNKFVPIYNKLEEIDTLLTELAGEAINGYYQAWLCTIIGQIIDRHKELRLQILSINDPQNIIRDGQFYNRLYIPVPTDDARSNSGLSNIEIEKDILSGVSEMGFHSTLVYDIYNPNNMERFIFNADRDHCKSINMLKNFENSDRQNILTIYKTLVSYYQDIYKTLIEYQYPDLGDKEVSNPLTLTQGKNLLKVDAYTRPRVSTEELIHQYPMTVPSISCEVNFKDNEGQVRHSKKVEIPEITLNSVSEERELVRDQKIYLGYDQDGFKELEIGPIGDIVAVIQYVPGIQGHMVGVIPHSYKTQLEILENNTSGKTLLFDYNYLQIKNSPARDTLFWEDIPLNRIENNTFQFNIDNKALLTALQGETRTMSTKLKVSDKNQIHGTLEMSCQN